MKKFTKLASVALCFCLATIFMVACGGSKADATLVKDLNANVSGHEITVTWKAPKETKNLAGFVVISMNTSAYASVTSTNLEDITWLETNAAAMILVDGEELNETTGVYTYVEDGLNWNTSYTVAVLSAYLDEANAEGGSVGKVSTVVRTIAANPNASTLSSLSFQSWSDETMEETEEYEDVISVANVNGNEITVTVANDQDMLVIDFGAFLNQAGIRDNFSMKGGAGATATTEMNVQYLVGHDGEGNGLWSTDAAGEDPAGALIETLSPASIWVYSELDEIKPTAAEFYVGVANNKTVTIDFFDGEEELVFSFTITIIVAAA